MTAYPGPLKYEAGLSLKAGEAFTMTSDELAQVYRQSPPERRGER